MPPSFAVNTFSYIWQLGIEACVEHLAERGHVAFEALVVSPHLWPSEFDGRARASLRGTLERTRSRIVSVNAGGVDNNLASPAADVRDASRRYLCSVVDLAADIGADFVVMSPGTPRTLLPAPRQRMLDWFCGEMEALVRHAESRGVVLLVENIPFSILPRAGDVMAAIARFPHERVGVVYDVANAVYVHEDPVAGLREFAPRLRLVHLSDTGLAKWEHAPVGRGVVPFGPIAAALGSLAFDGPVVAEIVSSNPDVEIAESIDALRRLAW